MITVWVTPPLCNYRNSKLNFQRKAFVQVKEEQTSGIRFLLFTSELNPYHF